MNLVQNWFCKVIKISIVSVQLEWVMNNRHFGNMTYTFQLPHPNVPTNQLICLLCVVCLGPSNA